MGIWRLECLILCSIQSRSDVMKRHTHLPYPTCCVFELSSNGTPAHTAPAVRAVVFLIFKYLIKSSDWLLDAVGQPIRIELYPMLRLGSTSELCLRRVCTGRNLNLMMSNRPVLPTDACACVLSPPCRCNGLNWVSLSACLRCRV